MAWITRTLDEVAGAGARVWHLMVGDFYYGRLRLANDKWFFLESKPEVTHLNDDFAPTVMAWYQ